MSKSLLICFDSADGAPLASFAARLGVPYDLLCVNCEPANVGAGRVVALNLPDATIADSFCNGVLSLAQAYGNVAAISSMQSKDILARLAGHLDAAMVSDVVSVVAPNVVTRPVVAGTMVATVEVLGSPCVYTVRPAGFHDAPSGSNGPTEEHIISAGGSAQRIAASGKSGGRPELTQAKVVVSGGRPLKDAETFERLIGGLADKLGGAVGATRAAVDSGIAPNECQVGQTGKIVAPELYIAAGISGSTQHMAGIKDSRIIVAINKDPDAPIFEFADFGLVADLYDAIPELMAKI